uniref:Uncharacterized protein n=1 Tax=viral metagenome TaxID=1070528 RepID=A0A6C0EKN3_9ZZZZ
MRKIICGILPLALILLAKKLSNIETIENTHPFGREAKNKKKYFEKDRRNFGKYTYWGKPSKKDTIKNSLDKLHWLGEVHNKEVIWRRALYFAIIITLCVIVVINYKFLFRPSKLLGILTVVYIGIYMHRSYDSAHLRGDQGRLIRQNVRKIKNKLKISHDNPLDNII